MYVLYSALLASCLLLTLPYWLLQMLRHGKYRAGLRQRFGAVRPVLARRGEKRAIWIHAVSVGEVVASSAVVTALREKCPTHRVLLSTTTSTGQKLAAQRFGPENVFYFPLDFAFAIRPYLDALRPELVVVAETEFWPNFLRLAQRSGARIAVINRHRQHGGSHRVGHRRKCQRAGTIQADVINRGGRDDARIAGNRRN